jgi:hypothetical protein
MTYVNDTHLNVCKIALEHEIEFILIQKQK